VGGRAGEKVFGGRQRGLVIDKLREVCVRAPNNARVFSLSADVIMLARARERGPRQKIDARTSLSERNIRLDVSIINQGTDH